MHRASSRYKEKVNPGHLMRAGGGGGDEMAGKVRPRYWIGLSAWGWGANSVEGGRDDGVGKRSSHVPSPVADSPLIYT